MYTERGKQDIADRVFWRPSKHVWLALATSILLIAATFRLASLPDIPPGLAQDEVLDADIASFIRQGEHAIFFRHGYGHEPLYHYWATPFQVLFGDNVLSVRLPSVFLGLFLIALTMRWGKRDYGSTAAFVAGAGLAISWWPIIFSRIGIRPILEPVLIVIAFWFWPLRAKAWSSPAIRRAAMAGVFLGLSVYSYTAARVILALPIALVIVFGIAYFLDRSRSRPELISPDRPDRVTYRAQVFLALVVWGIGLLVSLPLAVTLRADPSLQQRIEQLEGPLDALRAGDSMPVIQSTLATLGVFSFNGDPRWTYSLPHRPLFDWLTAILFYGGLIVAIWRWRWPIYAILPTWLVLALLPSALSPDAPSTVRLIGAMPVVYLLPGLALGVFQSRGRTGLSTGNSQTKSLAVAGGALLLIGLLVLNSFRTVRDGFISWPDDAETRSRYQAVLADIARYWQAEASFQHPPVVAEVFFEPIDDASLKRTLGFDPSARWIQTGAGVAGAIIWPAGQNGMSTSDLYVPEYAPLPVELMHLAGISERPIYRSPNSPSFAVYDLLSPPVEPPLKQNIRFGETSGETQITLSGFSPAELLSDRSGNSSVIHLATWWEINDRLPDDLAIFIHLLDEKGHLIAQYDGLDAAPATLRPGDVVLQAHQIILPEPLETGNYQIQGGLYRRSDGGRLIQTNGSTMTVLLDCRIETGNDTTKQLMCRLPESR